jgi:serine/threonine protein kinase
VTVAATLLGGRYSLEEQIGAGGFCEVWRATDTLLTRPVAVKLLHAGYAYQPDARARFEAEARHAGRLSHQNIARVYDYGAAGPGSSYLVMELIEGPSLDTVLASGPLGAARTLDIVAQVAAGLQAAHNAGLVHRDIKPANILFTPEGAVRIMDFGIAHAVGSVPLTATGLVMGTPGYIAPERVAGAQGGPASDLYALGIVAYECLAGAPPFTGPPLEVAVAHRDLPLPPLPAALPIEAVGFVMTLTAKDPAWRPASAAEVARQARRLRDRLGSGAIDSRPVAPDVAWGAVRSRPRTGWSRRQRILGAGALLALTALSCLALLTLTGLAFAAHPTARPAQAAPPSPTSRSTTPAATQPVGQQPAANNHGGAGDVAAVSNAPPGHPAHKPHPHHAAHGHSGR